MTVIKDSQLNILMAVIEKYGPMTVSVNDISWAYQHTTAEYLWSLVFKYNGAGDCTVSIEKKDREGIDYE